MRSRASDAAQHRPRVRPNFLRNTLLYYNQKVTEHIIKLVHRKRPHGLGAAGYKSGLGHRFFGRVSDRSETVLPRKRKSDISYGS